ncbi:MAG: VacJ family lipoprotein [Alphaproteobacteria bacterium]
MIDATVLKELRNWGAAAVIATAIAGCATAQPDVGNGQGEAAGNDLEEYEQVNDPLEPLNRLIFSANVAVDNLILQPISVVYRDAAPEPLKNNLKHLLVNLRLPLVFIHTLLQGEFDRAEQTAGRFLTNMLFLFMYDVGRDEPVQEDAGLTLAKWTGTGQGGGGPYIMLPLLGPSNARDAVGRVVDFFIDPVGVVTETSFAIQRAGAGAVDERSRNIDEVRDLQQNSLDYYATVRSLYRQRRATQANNGETDYIGPAPTIAVEFGAPE